MPESNEKPKSKKERELLDQSPEARATRARERAAQTLSTIANAKRKARTQRLIKLGSAVEAAGLSDWHEDTVLGACLALKRSETHEDWAQRESSWRAAGAQLRAERKAERRNAKLPQGVPVAVEFSQSFEDDPDLEGSERKARQTARKDLREAGLRWVRELGVWVGTVDFDKAHDVVIRYGGVIRRQDREAAS